MKAVMRVRVPATSANLGAGFDALGVSLSLYNVYEVMELLDCGAYRVEVFGEGSAEVACPTTNLVLKAYEEACAALNVEPRGLSLRSMNAVPLARGLGSSAGAVVAGVMFANALLSNPLPKEELLSLMVRIEGHPDNVVPCCVGGMTVSAWDGKSVRKIRFDNLPKHLGIVVAVPEVQVLTKDARTVLPQQVSLQDAAFNVSRAALFVAAWATGATEMLAWAMEDRLHQAFRAKLFPGGEAVLEKVTACPECLGVAISGSGPSILAFVRDTPKCVAETMCHVFAEHGVKSRFFVLDVDMQGAVLSRRDF